MIVGWRERHPDNDVAARFTRDIPSRFRAIAFILAAVLACVVSSCGSASSGPRAIIDCTLNVSYADTIYIGYPTTDYVEPRKKLGAGRFEHCGKLLGTVKVASVKGFSPNTVIRLVGRDKYFVYFREGIFENLQTLDDVPSRFQRLLTGMAPRDSPTRR